MGEEKESRKDVLFCGRKRRNSTLLAKELTTTARKRVDYILRQPNGNGFNSGVGWLKIGNNR